jgi:phage tail-like protein
MPEAYPLPETRFIFEVDLGGGVKMNFTEVTGLVIETEQIEFRNGNDRKLGKRVMPGLEKHSHLVLKRGVVRNDTDLYTWLEEIATEKVKRRDVIVRLLNEKFEPVVAWSATGCFPVKVTGPDLKSDANEVAIESIEIAHEGLKLMKI